jgi:tetraacyldisaccharide 4'-kinase
VKGSVRQRLWAGELPLLAAVLWPLEQLYRLGAVLDRHHGQRRAERVDVPVISVGNLVAGGAGKTPVTLLIARRLLDEGRKVGVISRGYGRRTRGLVVVSRGDGAVASASTSGDEPVLLARKEPRLVVAVAERRIDAARACVSNGCDVVVMDDGFSRHDMIRDLDILVVDAGQGFGNGRMLPAGPLREPPAQARRTGLVWMSKASPDSKSPLGDAIPCVRSDWRPAWLSDGSLSPVAETASLRGARVAAFCGIARPEAFRDTLTALGAEVVHFASFGDHESLSTKAMARFRAAARATGAGQLVCTEKDIVRLEVADADGIRALAMEAHLLGETAPLDRAISRLLEGPE